MPTRLAIWLAPRSAWSVVGDRQEVPGAVEEAGGSDLLVEGHGFGGQHEHPGCAGWGRADPPVVGQPWDDVLDVGDRGGQVPAGDRFQCLLSWWGPLLPSTREIAGEWQVAAKTAERAIALLRDEGIVRTRSGRAGSVVDRALAASIAVPMVGDCLVITAVEVTAAPEAVARELANRPGADVLRRQGILCRDDSAAAMVTSWLPASLAQTRA
jgi:hypothetical protein